MNSFKIFLFLISLFIFSCGESQDITKQLNINAESYQIPTGHTTGAKPQFFINYFVPSEKRPIMVHGYYPENDAPSFISATGVNVEYSTLGNGPNQYLQYVTNPPGYEYTVPLKIIAPNTIGDHNTTLVPSGSSSNILVRVGNSRNYRFTYNCMTNYDIYTKGWDFEDKLKDAFLQANTNILKEINNTQITPELIPYTYIITEWDEVINAFFKDRNIIPNQPNQNAVYVIGCKNVDWPQNPSFYWLGLTCPPNTAYTGYNYRIIVILVDRILNHDVITDTYRRKQFLTFSTLHELGHARGMNFTTEQGYGNNDITNSDHTFGHNGVLKNKCLMSFLSQYSSVDEFYTALDRCKFCFGHLQMLFNAEW